MLGETSKLLSHNVFAYCSNGSIDRIDPSGQTWWHWAAAAVVVVAAAIAVVATAGGVAAGIAAVVSVASGSVAVTTGSTIAAGSFIGAAAGFGIAVAESVATSQTFDDFADHGAEALALTVVGGVIGTTVAACRETGKTSFRVKASQVQNNPNDEFVTVGPKDGQVSKYVQQINDNSSYQALSVTRTGEGMFQLADGHHRMQALRILGRKYVQVIMVE